MCCSDKLLRLKQVTCKSTDDYPTLVRSQRGAQRAPDRSGPQAPVTKLSRRWPFGVAHLCGGTNGGCFFSFYPSLDKACVVVTNYSG